LVLIWWLARDADELRKAGFLEALAILGPQLIVGGRTRIVF